MTFPLSAMMLTLFGVSLILTAVSLRFLHGTPEEKEPTSTAARFFLIALRLAIGWHCLFEGIEKFKTLNWSSEAYLRESMGPFSWPFRSVAGDRLVEKLTVGEGNTAPPQLAQEWRDYVEAFAEHWDLTDEQYKRAQGILDQRIVDTLPYLTSKSEEVTKISAYPPVLKVDMTMPQRLQEHQQLLDKVRKIEDKFPTAEKDILKQWKDAKSDLSQWRAGLQKSLSAETDKLKKALEAVLTSEQKMREPMPSFVVPPMRSWQLLEWSDFIVKWSLLVLGGCLLVGLFSRPACLALGLLLFSFYLAMPPLPGWPESPRLEGHYEIINKTLIEIIALLALAFIPTGRWAGLDALLRLLFARTRVKTQTNPQV